MENKEIQVFDDELTARLQSVTCLKRTKDSVLLLDCLMMHIRNDVNPAPAIELYTEIMNKYTSKEN